MIMFVKSLISLRSFTFVCFATVIVISSDLCAAPDSAWVLEPRFEKNKSFTQIYTITALFGDTTLIQLQFTLTNLGLTDQNAACKILIVQTTRNPLCVNRKYGRKEWHYQSDFPQTLTLGSNRIAIHDSTTSVFANNGNVRVTVDFDCLPAVTIPPAAEVAAHNRFYESAVLIPWGKIQASLEQPGALPKTMTGYGMLELSRSTAFPTDVCRGWITFRGYRGETHFKANIRLPPDGKTPATGWVWPGVEQTPRPISDVLFDHVASNTAWNRSAVGAITAPDSSFRITPHAMLFRYSFIDELGPVLGAIVKLVIGNPVTYYYRATAYCAGDAEPMLGILEYMRIE
jgi:hypothetical protein